MDALLNLVFRVRRLLGPRGESAQDFLVIRAPPVTGRVVYAPVIDRTKVIREGWCLKESDHLKVWRRRWLVLTRQTLCTFKTDDRAYTQPTSTIDMSNVRAEATCERRWAALTVESPCAVPRPFARRHPRPRL